MRFPVLAAAAFFCCGSALGQLDLTLVQSFVDAQAGGNGNIGVTQDEVGGNFYVIDFSSTFTVHEFSPVGSFLAQFPTASCNPSAPSPNDIAWDPANDTLWLVDNDNNVVLETTRQGTCIGGFSLPASLFNPTGITVHRGTGTLYVSGQSAVYEVDKAGNVLGGGFSFTPATGSNYLAGITHVSATGNFLVVQSSGNTIFELAPNGALLSTTSLASFGVTNTQGLHYNPSNGTLSVVDNSASTVFTFLLDCPQAVTFGAGCAGSGGFVPTFEMKGCTVAGQTLQLAIEQGLGGAPVVLFVGLTPASLPIGGGCNLHVQPPAVTLVLPVPLQGVGPGQGTLALPAALPPGSPPVTLTLQAFVADAGAPILVAATNGVQLAIQ